LLQLKAMTRFRREHRSQLAAKREREAR
jgi:hypothetical protein